MFTRLRSAWLAGGSALLLAVTLSGVVAAAALVSVVTAPDPAAEPLPVPDTTLTFEDADGNGIDDDCQETVVADDAAAAAAEAAADLNSDGVISVSEAAQSGRIGGKNCNHGGYVSNVAHGTDACEAPATNDEGTEGTDEGTEGTEGTDEGTEATETDPDATCEEPTEDTTEPTDEEAPAECVTEPAPADEAPADEEPVDTAPNAHGKAVSKVAQDKEAVGGKNCNHGGAVSEAAHKDQAAKDAKKNQHATNHAAKKHGKHGN